MLEIKNITAGYSSARDVIRDVSLEVGHGTLTALVGKNGCGKSTLLKSVTGMIPRRCGEIITDGVSLTKSCPSEVARRISYLSQGSGMTELTVRETVLHGRFARLSYPRRYSDADRAAAEKVLFDMGLTELADKQVSKLSGGMQQRVYIAAVICGDTDYILLDEPTAYLDIGGQLELMKMLRSLVGQGKGVVAVMHDLPLAFTHADRIAVMDNGRLKTVGDADTVAASDAISEVFGVSVVRSEDGIYRYRY